MHTVPVLRTPQFRFGVLLLLGLTASCASKPSETDGSNALKGHIDNGDEQRLRIMAFKKVDGQTAEVMGVTTYAMMFRADAQFVTDATFSAGAPLVSEGESITTAAFTPLARGFSWNEFLAGSQGYHPARAGDRLALAGRITFEKSEAGWKASALTIHFALDSSQRGSGPGVAAAAAVTGAAQKAFADTSVSGRRCSTHYASHPLPKAGLMDKIRGRSVSVSSQFPDTLIRVLPGSAPVGSIAYLTTGEICVGATVLEVIPPETQGNVGNPYFLLLSKPSASGHRFLTVADDLDWQYASANKYGWIVNPDSMLPLAPDVYTALARGMTRVRMPLPSQWSPDGSMVALIAQWYSDKGVRRALVVTRFPHGPDKTIEVGTLLRNDRCTDSYVDASTMRWPSPDVITVTLKLGFVEEAVNCVIPPDSIATLSVDIARGQASRLR